MSAEHFETVLSCDMRTAPDGRGILYAEAGTGEPRFRDGDRTAWATCAVYAEQAVRIAATAVRDQPMHGLSGDHPARRAQVATILDAAADAVRALALDHAHDGALTDERWDDLIAFVYELSASSALGPAGGGGS